MFHSIISYHVFALQNIIAFLGLEQWNISQEFRGLQA